MGFKWVLHTLFKSVSKPPTKKTTGPVAGSNRDPTETSSRHRGSSERSSQQTGAPPSNGWDPHTVDR